LLDAPGSNARRVCRFPGPDNSCEPPRKPYRHRHPAGLPRSHRSPPPGAGGRDQLLNEGSRRSRRGLLRQARAAAHRTV